MTDNLLSQNPDPEVVNEDPNKDYLAELVGPGKKFATPNDLAKSKYFTDTHAKMVERENAELRDQILRERESNQNSAKLKDLIDLLESRRDQQLASSDQTLNANEVNKAPSLQDLESLIEKKYESFETRKRQDANFNFVKEKMQAAYGNNYSQVIASQLTDLGLDEQSLNEMARNRPKALVRMFGLDQTQRREGFQAPPSSNQMPNNLAPKGDKKTMKYWLDVKEKDPKAWLDNKIAKEMEKCALELGDEFWDA